MTPLDKITCSIVEELGSVGLYHYNKLTYLFEYSFIRNFGDRYTEEYFIKLPHGPVISKYKTQIESLVRLGYLKADLDALKTQRTVDDYDFQKICISKTETTKLAIVSESNIQMLLNVILKKYSSLSIPDLERAVYGTEPVQNCERAISMGFKKETGAYILKGDCLRISDFKNARTKGRKMALEHARKYPGINFEIQKEAAIELSGLSSLRPKIS